MKNDNKRLLRSEVPLERTWDLSDLAPSREVWQKKVAELHDSIPNILTLKGHVGDNAKALLKSVKLAEDIRIKLGLLGTYARLKLAGDGTDPVNQEDSMSFANVSTKVKAAFSFFEAEVIALSKTDFENMFTAEKELEKYRLYLTDIHNKRKHSLSPKAEEAIAALGELYGSPKVIYSVSKAADMVFESFIDDKGNMLPNSFALFESNYEYSGNAVVRERAYKSFVKTLKKYRNTYAGVYATEVRKQVAMSKLRNYESVTHMLLANQKVSIDMYENQLDIVYNQLAPHMRRFIKLKQKLLGLDKMRFYDLKAPIDAGIDMPATYENVREIIIEALGVMGSEYQGIIKDAFSKRWIDYGDNVGKSTGAFCTIPYNSHPFALITFQNNMRSAFLLSHELGHAGHFSLANKSQRVFDSVCSLYFEEAPSTMNEMLVAQYLMKQNDDPKMRRWVILQLMGTYYHNFVTHLLEGEFQRRVYTAAENGVSLTAKMLCDTKLAVIKGFWGDAAEIDEDASMTWMRQPHYYMGLYPYTYSAGLTVSTLMSQRIAKEGQSAVDSWLNVLRKGGSLKPQELAKLAGIDMTKPQPIIEVVEHIGGLITELENLFLND